jgi:hypothetical protein
MSHLDVLMQFLKTVYSHLKNKKKEQKRFLEYTNASNSYEFWILSKDKKINRSSSSIRLAVSRKLSKKLGTYIEINFKKMNLA